MDKKEAYQEMIEFSEESMNSSAVLILKDGEYEVRHPLDLVYETEEYEVVDSIDNGIENSWGYSIGDGDGEFESAADLADFIVG